MILKIQKKNFKLFKKLGYKEKLKSKRILKTFSNSWLIHLLLKFLILIGLTRPK